MVIICYQASLVNDTKNLATKGFRVSTPPNLKPLDGIYIHIYRIILGI